MDRISTELLTQIIESCREVREQRLFELFATKSSRSAPQIRFPSLTPIPVVFHVCTKFRQIAIQRFGHFSAFDNSFDFSKDTLFLHVCYIRHFYHWRGGGYLKFPQNLQILESILPTLKYILIEGDDSWTADPSYWLSKHCPNLEKIMLINGLSQKDRDSFILSQLTEDDEGFEWQGKYIDAETKEHERRFYTLMDHYHNIMRTRQCYHVKPLANLQEYKRVKIVKASNVA